MIDTAGTVPGRRTPTRCSTRRRSQRPGQAGTDGWALTDNLNTPRYIVNDNSAVVDHIMAEAF
ncbi:MAG TPA: hypothetical protein VFW94_09180, partial [Candidatus Acidoferrales bacterium]|nr:hypothetical protein [Candidatus Acidoferrales bacterium]